LFPPADAAGLIHFRRERPKLSGGAPAVIIRSTVEIGSSDPELHFEASPEDAGERLDRFLAARMPEESRARIQEWIRAGRVRTGGGPARPSARLRAGERIAVRPAPAEPLRAFPEEIALEILYEDGDLIAVNKPAGMTVHAGAGVRSGTLVNALLHRFERLSGVGGELRPGIVHRLDRFTSGVLLVAKNDRAHRALAAQFQKRQVEKTYVAIVHGGFQKALRRGRTVESGGKRWTRLEMPLGRSPRARVKMGPRREGRSAQTDFRVLSQVQDFSFLEVKIATGRTHQIRAHLAAVGRPVLGDRLYGAQASTAGLGVPERFYLHALRAGFAHPAGGRAMEIEAPLPAEFRKVLQTLGL